MSKDDAEAKGFVNIKFIVFLKATLGKMMGTNILPNNFLDLQFWLSWPRKFYNIKAYDSAKENVKKRGKGKMMSKDCLLRLVIFRQQSVMEMLKKAVINDHLPVYLMQLG